MVILAGIYSFLMATVLVALDAVDVAMTEAAVGAGISTVLFLSALYLSRAEEAKPLHKPLLPLVVVIATGGALVYGTLDLPAFSDPAAPIHHHVAPRYIEDAARETGVPNMVTAVLASYRGYDTLGETTVVFHRRNRCDRAATAPARRQKRPGVKDDLVLRVIAKLMTAFMLLFALYVQFHGDFGPGGGFQAGVIAAAAIIFYAIIFGIPAARQVVPDRLVEIMVALGVLIYAGVGPHWPRIRRQFPRLLRARSRSRARPAPWHLLGGSRRAGDGSRGHAEHLLPVRQPRARRRLSGVLRRRSPRLLGRDRHRDGGAVHRDCTRQLDSRSSSA